MNSKNSPLTYFRNMYLVAMADGTIAPEELHLLQEVAQKMGIDEDEQEAIKENAEILGFFVPNDTNERLEHLEYLIRMMMVDGDIHQQEYDLCLNYANNSGCDQLILDTLIGKVAQEKDSNIEHPFS